MVRESSQVDDLRWTSPWHLFYSDLTLSFFSLTPKPCPTTTSVNPLLNGLLLNLGLVTESLQMVQSGLGFTEDIVRRVSLLPLIVFYPG